MRLTGPRDIPVGVLHRGSLGVTATGIGQESRSDAGRRYAVQNVAALFETLPDASLSDRDRNTMATRFIALLPRRPSSEAKSLRASANVGRVTRSWFGASALLFMLRSYIERNPLTCAALMFVAGIALLVLIQRQ